MKSSIKLLGIIALVAVIIFSGCVTHSAIGGTSDVHGLFTMGDIAASQGRTEIASYNVILGLFSSGYAEYVAAVEAAAAQGKQISSVTKNMLNIIITTTAYAK